MFFHPFKWKATRLLRTLCFITFIACAVVLVVNVTTSLLSSDTTSQKTRSWIHQQPSRFFQTKVPSVHESDRSRQDSSNGSAHSPKEGGRRHVSWKEMTNQSRHRIKGPQEIFSVNDGIQVASFIDNCGLSHDCPADHFSLHLFTGFEDKEYPQLCVDGKYILEKDINGCGRGINVAVIDPIFKSIRSVYNFDTYDKGSSELESLLLGLREKDIIILLTFDEPSTKFSQVARLLLHELGSGKAQNLNFRTSWYLITQKGIDGYSPYEEIHLPSYLSVTTPSPLLSSSLSSGRGGKSVWGNPHNIRLCLPLEFEGVAVQADDTIRRNEERQKFCQRFPDAWPLFCESHVINDPLTPSTISRIPLPSDLFKTPIIVLTSLSMRANEGLHVTLETLLRQPSLEPKNVVVFYDSSCCESIRLLAHLFGFMTSEYVLATEEEAIMFNRDDNMSERTTQTETKPPKTKTRVIREALLTAQLLFPEANQLIVMESHVVLSPDFLPFMGQLIPLLSDSGTGVSVVSAWNENGFAGSSADPSLVFRASTASYYPRFAFMTRRLKTTTSSFRFPQTTPPYLDNPNGMEDASGAVKLLQHRLSLSFSSFDTKGEGEDGQRDGWIDVVGARGDILFPDVSRLSVLMPSSENEETEEVVSFLNHFMTRARNINLEEDVTLATGTNLSSSLRYEDMIRSMIHQSKTQGHLFGNVNQVASFLQDMTKADQESPSRKKKGKKFVTLECQTSAEYLKACEWFGLANCQSHLYVPGIGGVLRFSIPPNDHVFLVSAWT